MVQENEVCLGQCKTRIYRTPTIRKALQVCGRSYPYNSSTCIWWIMIGYLLIKKRKINVLPPLQFVWVSMTQVDKMYRIEKNDQIQELNNEWVGNTE